jgi:hypothetical protein
MGSRRRAWAFIGLLGTTLLVAMVTAIGTDLGSSALEVLRDEPAPGSPSSGPAPPAQTTTTTTRLAHTTTAPAPHKGRRNTTPVSPSRGSTPPAQTTTSPAPRKGHGETTPISPSPGSAPPAQTTTAPAPPAQPTRIRDSLPCVSHPEAETVTGLNLQDYIQSCLYIRADSREPRTATCPPSWICTWDEPNGRVTVRLGAGQTAMVGRAWSYYIPAYPANDRYRDICQFLAAKRDERGPGVEYIREPNQPRCP